MSDVLNVSLPTGLKAALRTHMPNANLSKIASDALEVALKAEMAKPKRDIININRGMR